MEHASAARLHRKLVGCGGPPVWAPSRRGRQPEDAKGACMVRRSGNQPKKHVKHLLVAPRGRSGWRQGVPWRNANPQKLDGPRDVQNTFTPKPAAGHQVACPCCKKPRMGCCAAKRGSCSCSSGHIYSQRSRKADSALLRIAARAHWARC
jgi:hypothetical protein